MKRVVIIAVGFMAVCAAGADDYITGTWSIAAQPKRSDSGKWRYATDTNGVPAYLCIKASAYAKGHKVSGTATVYYATAGRKVYETEYVKGKRHGQWRMWYPNGTVLSSGRFFHGDFTGIWTWRKPDGAISQTVDWGKVHGLVPTATADGYGGWNDMTMMRYADRIARLGPYPSQLIEPYIVTNASVVGEWGDVEPLMEFTRIKVSPPDNGIHTVTIRSSGCLARHVFTNRATFADGVRRFDRPVRTCPADPFRKAYLVGNPEYPRLFPESGLEVLGREIEENGESGARQWIGLAGEPRVSETKQPNTRLHGSTEGRANAPSSAP